MFHGGTVGVVRDGRNAINGVAKNKLSEREEGRVRVLTNNIQNEENVADITTARKHSRLCKSFPT